MALSIRPTCCQPNNEPHQSPFPIQPCKQGVVINEWRKLDRSNVMVATENLHLSVNMYFPNDGMNPYLFHLHPKICLSGPVYAVNCKFSKYPERC